MTPDLAIWTQEPPLVDEQEYTPTARSGWHAWAGTDGMPAEVEWCDFAAALVRLLKPGLVIETGVGSGFTTRRLAAALPEQSELLAFESGDEWREGLPAVKDFWTERVRLAALATPDVDRWKLCGLAVLDSAPPFRLDELKGWWRWAPPESVLLCHDTGNPRGDIVRTIRGLRIPGIWMTNPRGSFLGQK